MGQEAHGPHALCDVIEPQSWFLPASRSPLIASRFITVGSINRHCLPAAPELFPEAKPLGRKMRAVNEKSASPAFKGILHGLDGLIGIDVEAIGLLNVLGKEISADEADTAIEFQIACGSCGSRYQEGVGFHPDRSGEQSRSAGGNPVTAAKIYEETEPGQIDPFEETVQVCGA
jgi:hypothetical protein